MKIYHTLTEMELDKNCPFLVLKEIKELVNICKEDNIEISNFDDLIFVLGGTVNIIETEEDLKEIKTMNNHPKENRWLDITENACNFDIAEYLEDKSFALLWNATNNAGGAVYYVPIGIADNCSNIVASIRLSNHGDLKYQSISRGVKS